MNELLRGENGTNPLKAGACAPLFRLRDEEGKAVSAERLLRKGPLVVVFYRGEWCAYCASELAAIEKAMPEFNELGASVVAISPQLHPGARNKLAALTRLRDPHNEVAASFGVRYTLPEQLISLYRKLEVNMQGFNGDESWTLPLSALYVITSDGMVLYSEVHSDYAKHASSHNALTVLRAYKSR